jgi:hypothetical protein
MRDHLDRIHSDQKVFEMRLVLIKAKSLKTNSKENYEARVDSDQMVLWIATKRLVRVSRGQTQGLHSLKLKPRGTPRIESSQIRCFLW